MLIGKVLTTKMVKKHLVAMVVHKAWNIQEKLLMVTKDYKNNLFAFTFSSIEERDSV